jgi:hypothetical protein
MGDYLIALGLAALAAAGNGHPAVRDYAGS